MGDELNQGTDSSIDEQQRQALLARLAASGAFLPIGSHAGAPADTSQGGGLPGPLADLVRNPGNLLMAAPMQAPRIGSPAAPANRDGSAQGGGYEREPGSGLALRARGDAEAAASAMSAGVQSTPVPAGDPNAAAGMQAPRIGPATARYQQDLNSGGPSQQQLAAGMPSTTGGKILRGLESAWVGAGAGSRGGSSIGAAREFYNEPKAKVQEEFAAQTERDKTAAGLERQGQEAAAAAAAADLARRNTESEIADRDKKANAPPAAKTKAVVLADAQGNPVPGIQDLATGAITGEDGRPVENPKMWEKPAAAEPINESSYIQQYLADNKLQRTAANIDKARQAYATAGSASVKPTDEDAKGAAEDILNHRMAPSQMAQLYGGFGASAQQFKRMVMGELHKMDPNYDLEQAESDYQFSKSPQFQQTVRYMDSVQNSIPLVIDRATKLANGNIQSLNALVNLGKKQFESVDLAKFNTDRVLVADEIAKILQGGGTGSGTTDAKLEQAGTIIRSDDNPQVIAASLGDVQQLIGYRRDSLTRGTYVQRQASGAKAAGNAPPASGQGGAMSPAQWKASQQK